MVHATSLGLGEGRASRKPSIWSTASVSCIMIQIVKDMRGSELCHKAIRKYWEDKILEPKLGGQLVSSNRGNSEVCSILPPAGLAH